MSTDYENEKKSDAEAERCTSVVYYNGKNLTLCHVNAFIRDLSSFFSQMVSTRTVIGMPKRAAYLLLDHQEVDKALANFKKYARGISGNATVTISGGVLPVRNREVDRGIGCALVSITVRSYRSWKTAVGKKGRQSMSRALESMRKIAEIHHGSFRVIREWGEARFTIYLPLLSNE